MSMSGKRAAWLGAGVAAAWLAVALALLPAYGLTWDAALGDYGFGERLLSWLQGGEPTFLDHQLPSGLTHRAPHPEFPLGFDWYQLFPLASTLSAASCRLLWDTWGLVPAIQAHHLVNVLFVAWLLALVTVFVARRAGALAGVSAALLLACSPCFFGHAFNNPKDVPEACLYVTGAIAALGALQRGGAWRWILTGAVTAMAAAQKPNAVFLPIQMGLWVTCAYLLERAARRTFVLPGLLPGLAAGTASFALVYAALSPQLWGDPLARFGEHVDEMLKVGNTLTDGSRTATGAAEVDWHGVQHFLITTPPVLLALGLLGACCARVSGTLRLFLGLGVLVPVGRTLLPGMRDFDGVRHFLEFYPALAMLAALGLVELLRWTAAACARLGAGDLARRAALALAFTLLVAPGLLATMQTHPNGICYFNAFVGGLGGAQRAGIRDATDYWGNSYWQGLAWLDAHARHGANVLVPIAPWIVKASAPAGLRPDLRLLTDLERPEPPLYLMYVTRARPPVVRAVEDLPAVHEIRVQQGTILRIVDLPDDAAIAPVIAAFDRRKAAHAENVRRLEWIIETRERFLSIWELVGATAALELAEAEARLKDALPEALHEDAREILWLLDAAEQELRTAQPGLSRDAMGEIFWQRLGKQELAPPPPAAGRRRSPRALRAARRATPR